MAASLPCKSDSPWMFQTKLETKQKRLWNLYVPGGSTAISWQNKQQREPAGGLENDKNSDVGSGTIKTSTRTKTRAKKNLKRRARTKKVNSKPRCYGYKALRPLGRASW